MTLPSELYLQRNQPGYGEYVVYRPSMTLNFFFAQGTDVAGPHIARAIEAYMNLLPPGTLRCFKKANGEPGMLDAKVISRDLKKLKSGKADLVEMRYYSGTPGSLGEYGLVVDSNNPEPDFSSDANLLRLEFPPGVGESEGLEKFVSFASALAAELPFQTAHAGYALVYLDSLEGEAYHALPSILARYLGIDPAHIPSRLDMRDRVPDPRWLMFLNHETVARLGGPQVFASSGAVQQALPNGLQLRGAKCPPLGDVNRGAKDIGVLPELARIMHGLRYEVPWLFSDDFDPSAWLARYDNRPSQPWDNG